MSSTAALVPAYVHRKVRTGHAVRRNAAAGSTTARPHWMNAVDHRAWSGSLVALGGGLSWS
jgi:hypothetical protein